jgi:hypothetical protein
MNYTTFVLTLAAVLILAFLLTIASNYAWPPP